MKQQDNIALDPNEGTLLHGFRIKQIEGHGWTVEPPSGAKWIAFAETPIGDFLAASLSATHADSVQPAKAPAVRVKAPANDREMLIYLMNAFDSEIIVCDQCGEETETKIMDSAHALKDYLASHPSVAQPTQQSEPAEADAERWGPALNEASWAFALAYVQSMSLPMTGGLFNQCKRLIRTAILTYLQNVAADAAQAAPADDAVLAALRELVRLKDLKDSRRLCNHPQRSDEWKEHDRLAPAAWQAAHTALATSKQGEGK